MASQSHALQQCFNEIAESAPRLLERCLNQVVSELQQAEVKTSKVPERTELGEAWRELLQHQAEWCRRYPEELRDAFKTAGKPKAPHPPAAESGRSSSQFATLSLVDDSEINQAIESSRLVQHVMPMVERPVSELDALVSSALGLPTIQPELNPVRPEVFAQTLRTVIGRTPMQPATNSLWMKYLANPLGHELQELYARLVTQLKDANVQAAEYRVVQQAASEAASRQAAQATAPGRPGAPQPTASRPPATTYSDLTGRQISHALLRDFLYSGGGDQAAQALPSSYYDEVDRELASLRAQAQDPSHFAPPAELPQGYRDLPVVERPVLAVDVQSTLSSKWGEFARSHERSLVRTRLRRDAKRVAQVLGLELVRKVVNQVAQDPRLLAPVREAIVALEPALLHLAMVDPRFFSEEHHPGRRLMESVAQRSFKFNDEFSVEFAAFFQQVSDTFNGLNQAQIESTEPFDNALAALEATWTAQDREEEAQREQAVKAMRFAELRQLEADRIAWELSSRTDLASVPPVVQDFLFGRWALVLAHARLTDTQNQIDPHGYRSLISDLLWSVKPEVTLRQPAQLFERVPRLVGKLREGLALLGHGPEDNEPFFQALMQLHRPVLKLRRAKTRRDAMESGHAPLSGMTPLEGEASADSSHAELQAEPKKAEDQLWLSSDELHAAGFQETLPTDMADLMSEQDSHAAPLSAEPALAEEPKASQPAPEAAKAESSELVLSELREGDWVDLFSKRKWLRAQLIWASAKGTLFMFVSHGGQPHTMTKRICERLIRERYLRRVRTHGVVAHALGALEEPTPT